MGHRFVTGRPNSCIIAGWCAGKIGSVTITDLASRRHGRTIACQCADSCRHHGYRRCVSDSSHQCIVQPCSHRTDHYSHYRCFDFIDCRIQCIGATRPEADSGVFNHQPNWVHVLSVGRRCLFSGNFSFYDSRLLQSVAFPGCRSGYSGVERRT